MKVKWALALFVMLQLGFAGNAAAGHKNKKDEQRGMVEKMDSIPCGAKQRGVSGVGSVWASIGITHINSQEKLCQQYLLRTDDTDYEIRPTDLKHPTVLPVGKEAEFRLKNNRVYLRVPDTDEKTKSYEIVSVNPNHTSSHSDSNSSANYSNDERSSNERR